MLNEIIGNRIPDDVEATITTIEHGGRQYGVGTCWVLHIPCVALVAGDEKIINLPSYGRAFLSKRGLPMAAAEKLIADVIAGPEVDPAWAKAHERLMQEAA